MQMAVNVSLQCNSQYKEIIPLKCQKEKKTKQNLLIQNFVSSE